MAGGVAGVEQARQRLQEVERQLNGVVVGHEDFVKALLLGAVAGEHVVVIGPPGTAKSYAVRAFAQLCSASFYSYLMTRFTTYDELFGTVDVTALAKGEFRRNWSRILQADFIFLDEIFKANSAILNALLSLLQERIVYDPMSGTAQPAALHTAVGASNETPDDPELQALYDRFAIRVFIDYLGDDVLLLRAIQARWLNSNSLQPVATMQDVKTLHQFAVQLIGAKIKDLGEVYRLYHVNVVPLLKSLRAKGVLVSDRTVIEKMPKLFAAYLALYGVTLDNVMGAPYELARYLARTRDELKEVEKAVNEALGEVAELAKMLERAKEEMRARNLNKAKELLVKILDFDLKQLEKTPWLKPKAEAIMKSARTYLENVERIEEQLRQLAQ